MIYQASEHFPCFCSELGGRGRVEVVRMRLWSFFCGGNKTSDVLQFTNNYLCSRASQLRQRSHGLRNESAAQHVEAKPRVVVVVGVVVCVGGGDNSLQVRQLRIANQRTTSPSTLRNLVSFARVRRETRQTDSSWGQLSDQERRDVRYRLSKEQTPDQLSTLKSPTRRDISLIPILSSFLSCSDLTSTFLWHTRAHTRHAQRKQKPIIISAAN